MARLSLCILVAIAAGCSLPRDPEGTLQRVEQGTMRVGLVENPPSVGHGGAGPAGLEVRLVQRFAHELGARIQWRRGAEQASLDALKAYELDLVIGGLENDNPRRQEVGLTRPYFTNRIRVGGRTPTPDSLKNLEIAVAEGSAWIPQLQREDALPLRLANPFAGSRPVAAPEWELARNGLAADGPTLIEEKMVMAIPPGENRWLARLERFLSSQRTRIGPMLAQGSAP